MKGSTGSKKRPRISSSPPPSQKKSSSVIEQSFHETISSDPHEHLRRAGRADRFQLDLATLSPAKPPPSKTNHLVQHSSNLVGTSTRLEKNYYRLHDAPPLDTIRPPLILRQSLQLVMDKWRQNADYEYACEQLKAIRQDLTVQKIRNHLTIAAYETHARIAIEVSDWGEYHQCQTVLSGLYDELDRDGKVGNAPEFMAYRILHAASTPALPLETATVPRRYLRHPFVQHAIKTSSALIRRDYATYYRMYRSAPRMAIYLMDRAMDVLRSSIVKVMAAAYRPSLPIDFVGNALNYDLEDERHCSVMKKQLHEASGRVVGGEWMIVGASKSRVVLKKR